MATITVVCYVTSGRSCALIGCFRRWALTRTILRSRAWLQSRNVGMEEITDVSVSPCTNSRYIQPFRVNYKQNGKQKVWDCVKKHDSVGVLIFNTTRKAFVFVRQFRPAVYMSHHRPLWENSDLFTASLSLKPSSDRNNNSTGAGTTPSLESGVESQQAATPHSTSSSSSSSPSSYGPGSLGFTYELCAGIVDKEASLEQIAKEEILEETGYDVPIDKLELITTYNSYVGTGGAIHTNFYVEVTDSMHVSSGGGSTQEGESIEVIHLPMQQAKELVFDSSKARPSSLCFSLLWFEMHKKPKLNLS